MEQGPGPEGQVPVLGPEGQVPVLGLKHLAPVLGPEGQVPVLGPKRLAPVLGPGVLAPTLGAPSLAPPPYRLSRSLPSLPSCYLTKESDKIRRKRQQRARRKTYCLQVCLLPHTSCLLPPQACLCSSCILLLLLSLGSLLLSLLLSSTLESTQHSLEDLQLGLRTHQVELGEPFIGPLYHQTKANMFSSCPNFFD